MLLNDDIAASAGTSTGQVALDMTQMQQYYDQSTDYVQVTFYDLRFQQVVTCPGAI